MRTEQTPYTPVRCPDTKLVLALYDPQTDEIIFFRKLRGQTTQSRMTLDRFIELLRQAQIEASRSSRAN